MNLKTKACTQKIIAKCIDHSVSDTTASDIYTYEYTYNGELFHYVTNGGLTSHALLENATFFVNPNNPAECYMLAEVISLKITLGVYFGLVAILMGVFAAVVANYLM